MHSVIINIFVALFLSSCNGLNEECACNFDYAPVCSNGEQFDNACLAKCNNVESFEQGPCKCNENSGEVCAIPRMNPCPEGKMCSQVMPKARLFQNECAAMNEKAHIVSKKECL